jgi:serine/threonine protein kinase/Tfp pilus assembly protein PilF
MGVKCPKCQHENPDDTLYCGKCGGPLKTAKGNLATKTLITPKENLQKGNIVAGRYTIIEELGRGGMGVVYQAEDTQLKRTAALKFLPPDRTHIPELHERFMHEAQAAAALNHPNIVTIYEINEHQDQTYIAMEYVEGQTLKDRIDRGPLPLEEAIDIALQIAEGLKKAHQKVIVHRDIKPANIIITDEGVVKILDFGVAKLKGTTCLTQEGTTIGTAAYMSSEQASGKEADQRSDIWSLGVILYEMITGRLPFMGEHNQTVIYAILNQEPEPVTGLRSGVPMELERIIDKALAKDPEERYQNVADLKVDLKTLAKRAETTATSPSVTSKVEHQAVANKKRAALKRVGIAAAGLIVILAAAALLLLRAPSDTIDSLAVLPFVNQSSDDSVAWLSTGIPETVITSLQQIPKLRVTSFLSLLERYRDAQPSVEDVKRHYDVRAVAKGRVSVVRQNISVHVEIVDTRNQSVIFANQYQIEDMEGLLDLQKSIARDITEHLQTRLAGKPVEPVFSRHTPDSAAYHNYLRGRYFWYKRTPRDLERALDYFQKAIAGDPAFALAWSGLSDTYHLMPQNAGASRYRVIPLAREAAEKALELDDTLAETQTSMGGVLNSEQKFAEAEKHFQKAIELNPNYLLAYHWSGVNLGDWRQDKEAIERYQEALRLDPMSPIIAANLSLEYRNMGHYDRAKEILDKAISLNPESSTPYIQYAWLLIDRGDPQKAVEMAEKAFSLDSTSLFSIQQVVYICLYAKHYDRAIEILEGMMAREPAFQRPGHALLGITYQRMKEYEKALEHHRKAIDIDPLDVDSYWDLGDTYYYFKEWQKAADAYKKIIELEPEEGDALQMLGCVLGILGRSEEEWECYRRAAELMPVHSIELGVWHLNYGDYEKAVSGLIKAEKDSPNYANNRFYLFTAQFLSGDFKGAERSLSEWLSRIDYKGREALRAQAFPDGSVNKSSVIRYVRLILERFKEENREIGGRYEARLPATFYFLTGDFESAIETLEYAYENFEERSFWLPWYIRFSYFKPLHDDPRFWEIIKKMKLAPYFSKDNLPYIK